MRNSTRHQNTITSFRREAQYIPRAQHTVSRKDISKAALQILYRLQQAGYQACLVGGCVRDLLLGSKPKDFDVATDAHPQQIRELFRKCRLIGRRFRLAHVRIGAEVIEVSTFRATATEANMESTDAGRILRDNVYGTIDEDVWRRDFTVNALFYNIADFSILDYTGGIADIRKKQLRLIGDPERRYREDPVRMLRAVRLAAKLNMHIHSPAAEAIHRHGALLSHIPAARLFEEFQKMFLYGHGEESFNELCKYELVQFLFPAALETAADPQAAELLRGTLRDTDRRCRQRQPVSPGFLLAALLWVPFKKQLQHCRSPDLAPMEAVMLASDAVLSRQARTLAVPHRHTAMVRDIWILQERFHEQRKKRRARTAEHRSLPAAVDFLQLRAASGEETGIDVSGWETLAQEARRKKHGHRRRYS